MNLILEVCCVEENMVLVFPFVAFFAGALFSMSISFILDIVNETRRLLKRKQDFKED